MSKLNLDRDKLELVRRLAEAVILPVHHQVERHSTVAIERCLLRILGVEESQEARHNSPESKSLVQRVLEVLEPEDLTKGVAHWFCLAAHHFPKLPATQLAQKIADGEIRLASLALLSREELELACQRLLEKTFEKVKMAQEQRVLKRPPWHRNSLSLTQAHLGSGDPGQDAQQLQLLAELGIDIIKLERQVGQGLLDEVPSADFKLDSSGPRGTLLTDGYIAQLRELTDSLERKQKRRIALVSNVQGLASPELTWISACEGADYVVCDPFYGVFFRDINLKRSLIDHQFSYRLCALLGLKVHTCFEDYTSDPIKFLSSYVASQLLTLALAKKAGLEDKQVTLGYSFAAEDVSEDALLYEWSELQLLREVFPFSPLQLSSNAPSEEDRLIFHQFSSLLIGYCIQDLGLYQAKSSSGVLYRYLAQLRYAQKFHKVARSAKEEIYFQSHGKLARQARQVFDDAVHLLQKVKLRGLVSSVETGAFLNLAREQSSGLGHEGVFLKGRDYLNPLSILTAPRQSKSGPERREKRSSLRSFKKPGRNPDRNSNRNADRNSEAPRSRVNPKNRVIREAPVAFVPREQPSLPPEAQNLRRSEIKNDLTPKLEDTTASAPQPSNLGAIASIPEVSEVRDANFSPPDEKKSEKFELAAETPSVEAENSLPLKNEKTEEEKPSPPRAPRSRARSPEPPLANTEVLEAEVAKLNFETQEEAVVAEFAKNFEAQEFKAVELNSDSEENKVLVPHKRRSLPIENLAPETPIAAPALENVKTEKSLKSQASTSINAEDKTEIPAPLSEKKASAELAKTEKKSPAPLARRPLRTSSVKKSQDEDKSGDLFSAAEAKSEKDQNVSPAPELDTAKQDSPPHEVEGSD